MVAIDNLLYTIGGCDDRVVLTDTDMVDVNALPCDWIDGPSLNTPRYTTRPFSVSFPHSTPFFLAKPPRPILPALSQHAALKPVYS